MSKIKRSEFLKISGISALSMPFSGFAFNPDKVTATKRLKTVQFIRDGLDLSPAEYSDLLVELSGKYHAIADSYSLGGIVAQLEQKFAEMLGKESAVFMPTGTLANHIALRELAGNRRRAIVQAESHIYNDSGDCAQYLSGLHLVPLAPNRSTFTLDEVKEVIKRTTGGRVKTEVGTIMIESPVRRMDNRVFDYTEMKNIRTFAEQHGIKMHLDGARLFNAVAHTGIDVKEFTTLFDTVYVSLYKDFSAASGALLAGSKAFCENLFNVRRMFGGGLVQVWPFAIVALHFADSFLPEYKKALKQFDVFSGLLSKDPHFRIETYPDGTNVFKLKVKTNDIEKFRQKLSEDHILLPPPVTQELFKLKINPTFNRQSPEYLVNQFRKALIPGS